MKLVRTVGVLALLVIVVAIWMEIVSWQFGPAPKGGYVGGFRKPSMALTFVSTVPQIEEILGRPGASRNREIIRNIMMIDFLWIACYGLLFVAISALLYKRNCPWARHLAAIAFVAGVGAAAFDVKENLAVLKVLNCFPCEQSLVNELNDAALLKWTMSFVAMALLAIAFQDLNNRWAHWISISFIVTALVGFIGLWKHPLLGLVPIPLLVGLALLVVAAAFRPRHLKETIS